jgi:hypothetical protein
MSDTTSNENKKRTKWHIRDAELCNAVRYCIMFRLTEKESLDHLEKIGHAISYRTFRRIKSKLESSKERPDRVLKQDLVSQSITARDTLESLKERLFEMLKNSKSVSEELKVICEIRKTSREIFEIYDSSPVIAALLQQENSNHVEESKKGD